MKLVAEAADVLRPPPDGLVVLLYHRVGAATGVSVDLSARVFDEQMAALASGTHVVGLDDAVGSLREGRSVEHRVVVTFDDGTADFVEEALPILVRYGVRATVYVATDFVESQRWFPDHGRPCSWAGLADAVSTGLVDVGSHTHNHRLLDRLAPIEVAQELDRSIGLIEDRLGRSVGHFAYPKAIAPSPAADAAVRARFRSAVLAGTRPNPATVDVHRLARSPIQVEDRCRWFRRKVAGGMGLEDDLRRVVDRRRHAGAVA